MRTLTRVRLVFVEDRTNVWMRFGRSAKERILNRHCRDIYFTPRSIFACVTWRGDVERTLDWRVEVLRTAQGSERVSQLENVEPGAEILLRTSGQSKVQTMLALFDSIENSGIQLIAVSPDYWRCVHNRLAANQTIGAFGLDSYLAFERRKKCVH